MASEKHLNADGLLYFWTKLKSRFLSLSGGTMTGSINMGSSKITNVGTPTNDTDASTKKYVDEQITAVTGGEGVVTSVNGKKGAVTLTAKDVGAATVDDIPKTEIAANTNARHEHSNKTVLDGITTDKVTKWDETLGVFRITVTSSNRVYSADKTFAEIKAAYDAGQQPFVVLTGGTFDLVYTLASFSVPDGTGHDFVDFKRYLIWEDTLETETLRIYSYTTDSGSNIENRTSSFDVPSGTTYIAVNSTSDVISTVNGETFTDILALITGGSLVVIRYSDMDFYFGNKFEFLDASVQRTRLNFYNIDSSSITVLTLREDNTWRGSRTELAKSSDIPTDEINANTAARHSHDNKTVLDGITSDKVTTWDNKGTYSKPSGGIPKTDLASGVQTSLGKADAALPRSGGTVTGEIALGSGGKFTFGQGATIGDNYISMEQGTITLAMGSIELGENAAFSADTIVTIGRTPTADTDAANKLYVDSAITNKGYQTASQVQTAIANASHLTKQKVNTKPANADAAENVIYMVPRAGGGFTEYLKIDGTLEELGDTQIDLSGYVQSSNFITNAEIDTILSK